MPKVPNRSRLPRRDALPGRSRLLELPRRVLAFLRTAGSNAEVRLALATVGYRKEHHDEGIALLVAAIAYGASDDAIDALLAAPKRDPRAAEAALHEFAQRDFARLHAAARRISRGEAARLFDGLLPCPRELAIVHVALFLERLDACAEPRLRELFAARAFDASERARLDALLDEARAAELPAVEAEAFHRLRRRELEALWAWWAEWSAAAQSVVTRRTHRVWLGIGDGEP